MLLLSDALPHVSLLSRCFQAEHCDYSTIPQQVEAAVTALTHMANLKSFPDVIAKLQSSGISVPGQFNKETFNSTVRVPFLNALIGT